MNATRKLGWVQASPTEHLIHFRRGRVIRQGLGLGSLRLPHDYICIVPCTANTLTFTADQITQENQGVEVTGFAVWRIAKPEIAVQRFDFGDSGGAISVIGVSLQEVVESALRHRVANMGIEDVLRKRASIILELKREMEFITNQWGLEIDTIEIKNVRILSAQVFAQIQAPYRESLRLQNETTTLSTEREIRTQKLAYQEAMGAAESELRRQEQTRGHSERCQKAELEQTFHLEALERETAAQNRQIQEELLREQTRLEAEAAHVAAELAVLPERQRLAVESQQLALQECRSDLEKACLKAEADTHLAQAANQHRSDLALVQALPEISRHLKIGELNLTPDVLASLRGLLAAWHAPESVGG